MLNNTLFTNITQGSLVRYESYLSNPIVQAKYLMALCIFVGFWIISEAILFITRKYVEALFAKTETDVDDRLIAKTKRPIAWWLRIVGLRLGISYLAYEGTLEVILERLLDTLHIILFMYILIALFNAFIEFFGHKWAKKSKTSLDDQLLPLVHRIMSIIMAVIGVIWIIKTWGVEITPFLASLGIAGLAISFAFQDALKNIIGGVALILDKNFNLNDSVRLSSGETGRVREIGLRSTKIQSWDGELIIIPNGVLSNATIWNVDLPHKKLRVVVNAGVAYGSDIDKVKKIIMKEIKTVKDIVDDPAPYIEFTGMGDFALNIAVKVWIPNSSVKIEVKDELTTKIYNAFKKNRIEIPFPTRTIYTKKG